jgi:hypothetical protein
MPPRHIGDLHMPNVGQQPLEILQQPALHYLHMVEVILQPQIGMPTFAITRSA